MKETVAVRNGKKVKLINGKEYSKRIFSVSTDWEFFEFTTLKQAVTKFNSFVNEKPDVSLNIFYKRLYTYNNGMTKEYTHVATVDLASTEGFKRNPNSEYLFKYEPKDGYCYVYIKGQDYTEFDLLGVLDTRGHLTYM